MAGVGPISIPGQSQKPQGQPAQPMSADDIAALQQQIALQQLQIDQQKQVDSSSRPPDLTVRVPYELQVP